MAKDEKKIVMDEVPVQKTESSENKPEVNPVPVSYTHIDEFLATAAPFFKMNRMQSRGFKMRMNGRHYQSDEQVFIKELKEYLNLK